jgi:hypothetical protein
LVIKRSTKPTKVDEIFVVRPYDIGVNRENIENFESRSRCASQAKSLKQVAVELLTFNL